MEGGLSKEDSRAFPCVLKKYNSSFQDEPLCLQKNINYSLKCFTFRYFSLPVVLRWAQRWPCLRGRRRFSLQPESKDLVHGKNYAL